MSRLALDWDYLFFSQNFMKFRLDESLTSTDKKIAEIKMPDLNASDVESAMRMIAGTARSMGIVVKG